MAWNLMSQNPLLAEKWQDHVQRIHRGRLRKMRSTVDTRPPATAGIKINRGKRAQLKKEQREKVARENNLLIRKILELDSQHRLDRYRMFHRLPTEYSSVPRTLNGAARRRSLAAITRENKAVLQRIIAARPTFDRNEWTEGEKERKEISKRIAARPRYRPPSARRRAGSPAPRKHRLVPARPQTARARLGSRGESPSGGSSRKSAAGARPRAPQRPLSART